MDFDPGAGSFAERFDKLITQLSGAPNKVFERDCIRGGADGLDHGREDLNPVNQFLDLVAANEGIMQLTADRLVKRWIAHAVIRFDRLANDLFDRLDPKKAIREQ